MATEIYTNPFPHAVIDNYLPPGIVRQINSEWPDVWHKEDGKANRKWSTSYLPGTAQSIANAIDLCELEQITGIDGLFADPDLFGAGLHCIPPTGFLCMHVDFNGHPNGWHRRVNLLIYLNEEWDDSWDGHLMLGKHQEKAISPIGGRAVIFETNSKSWHGHPKPLNCPPDKQRRSLALYFYTEAPPDEALRSTIYQKK